MTEVLSAAADVTFIPWAETTLQTSLTSCGAEDLEDNGNDSNIQNDTDNNSISLEKIICE